MFSIVHSPWNIYGVFEYEYHKTENQFAYSYIAKRGKQRKKEKRKHTETAFLKVSFQLACYFHLFIAQKVTVL